MAGHPPSRVRPVRFGSLDSRIEAVSPVENKLKEQPAPRRVILQIVVKFRRHGAQLRQVEERVALLLLDTEIYPQAFFGAIKIGAVPVCLNTLNRSKDFEFFLNDSRARVLVVDALLLDQIEPIRAKLRFLKHIIVANGNAPSGDLSLSELTSSQSTSLETAPTCRDDSCFWLYSSG